MRKQSKRLKVLITLTTIIMALNVYSFSGQNLNDETDSYGNSCSKVFIQLIKDEIDQGNPVVEDLRKDSVNLVRAVDIEDGSHRVTREVVYIVISNQKHNDFILIKAQTTGREFCEAEKFKKITKIETVRF